MRVQFVIAGPALLFGACLAPAELGRPRTPLQVLQRPFEPDLTTASFAARTRRLGAVGRQLAGEPARIDGAPATAGRLLGSELARPANLPARVAGRLRGEADRVDAGAATAGTLLHDLVGPGGDGTHHAEVTAQLLGLDRAPLGEIDDHRHRTDPDDDRPEAGLVQRLLRRLRL